MTNKSFTITTSKEAAEQIRKELNSDLFEHRRSLKIVNINHCDSYSIVCIEPMYEDKPIKPEDIFFLGYYVGASGKY